MTQFGADDPQLARAMFDDGDDLESLALEEETVLVVPAGIAKVMGNLIAAAGVLAVAAGLLIAAGAVARLAWYLLRLGWSI